MFKHIQCRFTQVNNPGSQFQVVPEEIGVARELPGKSAPVLNPADSKRYSRTRRDRTRRKLHFQVVPEDIGVARELLHVSAPVLLPANSKR